MDVLVFAGHWLLQDYTAPEVFAESRYVQRHRATGPLTDRAGCPIIAASLRFRHETSSYC